MSRDDLECIAEKLDKLTGMMDSNSKSTRIFTTTTGEGDSWTTQKPRISWKTIWGREKSP